jgi:hypothetical protein
LPTQRKRRWYLLIYMMPQTRRMEKSIVRRASSGVGCSNDKGRSRALHPDLTKTGKSIVCRASSGVGCSNDKGRSQVLHPDLTKMGKSIVRRASSGIGCSNDKGWSRVLQFCCQHAGRHSITLSEQKSTSNGMGLWAQTCHEHASIS